MQNESILAFYWGDWPRPITNETQCTVLSRLSKENRVFVIESPITIISLFIHWRKLLNWLFNSGRPRKVSANLYVFAPLLFLPYHPRLPLPLWLKVFINKINNPLIKLQVNHWLKKHNINNPILMLTMLHPAELITCFEHRLSCVLCYDETSASPIFSPSQQELIKKFENSLLPKADFVFVTSKKLFETKKEFNKNTYLCSNAVPKIFINEFDKPTSMSLPQELETIPSPRICYVGQIDVRVNLQMISNIAKQHQDWHWIIIGPIKPSCNKIALKQLKGLSNIHFLGQTNHLTLSSFLKNIDICILPFKINKYTENMLPLKIFQYLACGRPIVTTNLPEIRDLNKLNSQILYISNTNKDFGVLIEKALQEKDFNLSALRKNIARENTWAKRTAEISKVIDNYLSHPNQG